MPGGAFADSFERVPVRGYRIQKKGDDLTMALTVDDRDVAAFKVGTISKAVQLGGNWERSL